MKPDGHVNTRERFDSASVASRYAAGKNIRVTRKNRQEMARIEAALEGIPAGASILDLPTGTGRLLSLLLGNGYEVLAADYSEHMLTQARRYCESLDLPAEQKDRVQFRKMDVMETGLPDSSVDVVICNRLLHHYPDRETRRQALAELARIARQRVIVSYFSNLSLSAARFHLKNRLLRRQPDDRIPIWPSVMHADVASVGLTVRRTLPVRFGLSPQTYLVLSLDGG